MLTQENLGNYHPENTESLYSVTGKELTSVAQSVHFKEEITDATKWNCLILSPPAHPPQKPPRILNFCNPKCHYNPMSPQDHFSGPYSFVIYAYMLFKIGRLYFA